jgi:uncharacterized membrane protein YciS (DUF1049 family)
MLKTVFIISLMATLVVAIIFGVVNFNAVTIDYLLGKSEVPLSILLFATFLLGLLFGISLDSWVLYRQRNRIHKLEKRAKMTEEELSNLRKMPLKDFEG